MTTADNRIPRTTTCALCRHYMFSEHFRGWFCSLHHHVVESPRCRCSWGREKGDSEVSDVSNGTNGTKL